MAPKSEKTSAEMEAAAHFGDDPSKCRVLVLGSGNFGSCLADHLTDLENPYDVYIWSRSADVVKSMNEQHKNPKYLKEHTFRKELKAVGPELPDGDFMKSCKVLIWAIPTQNLRNVLKQVHERIDQAEPPLMVFVCKGLEGGTNALPIEIIAATLGQDFARDSVFLSGPSFAKEIVARQPTQVSVASFSDIHATRTAALFHQPHFRCYTNPDPVGVEAAGALKNVYAIAAGCAEGLGFSNNTRAGLVTRSLNEMTKVGVAFGANPLTFLSLAGVGDLFLTCSSTSSRNYTVGRRLGQGEKLSTILSTLGSVAEGVATAAAAHDLLQTLPDVHAPIAERVYELVHEGKPAAQVADELMKLPIMGEGGFEPQTAGGRAQKFRELVGLD